MKNTITNAIAIRTAIAMLEGTDVNPEVLEKLSTIATQYENKGKKPSKATRESRALNKALEPMVLEVLENSAEGCRVSEIVKALGGKYPNSRITTVLRGLLERNLVAKSTVKGNSIYTKA